MCRFAVHPVIDVVSGIRFTLLQYGQSIVAVDFSTYTYVQSVQTKFLSSPSTVWINVPTAGLLLLLLYLYPSVKIITSMKIKKKKKRKPQIVGL